MWKNYRNNTQKTLKNLGKSELEKTQNEKIKFQ